MKKLMITAFALALAEGAFASYNLVSTNELSTYQVFQYKAKASSLKYINLDKGRKAFGKKLTEKLAVVDGVYYYDFTAQQWVHFSWSADAQNNDLGTAVAAPAFHVFEREDKAKALAVWAKDNQGVPTWFEDPDDPTSARAWTYANLSYKNVKDELTGVKTKVLDTKVKSLKNTFGSETYSIKDYTKKTDEKSVEAVNKAVETLIKKATKYWVDL